MKLPTWRLLGLIGLLAAALLLAGFSLRDAHRSFLLIENHCGRTLSRAVLEVCGESHVLEDLAAGASDELTFSIPRDGACALSVTLSDGTTFHASFGYVTPGYVARALVEVYPEELVVHWGAHVGPAVPCSKPGRLEPARGERFERDPR